jgi:glycine cleavage system transcriptional repressor
MKHWFALTAIGHDRPGIVADLAELIYECDCNLEDSRMTVLGSEFAVLLLCSGQGDDVARRLSTASKRLEWEKRLTVFVRQVEGPSPPGRGELRECRVTGVDRAGIVARVARTLSEHGANVVDLASELRHEPNSGTPMYAMRIKLVLPPDADVSALRAALERIATELSVDLTI